MTSAPIPRHPRSGPELTAAEVLADALRQITVAYADPPYLGCCGLYVHHHPDGRCWDDLETHRLLIERLVVEFPDGWALSLTSSSLQQLLPLCPPDVRIGAWVKPFASFKPNINPAYAWEPVIWRGGRCRTYRNGGTTVRDWVSEPMSMKRGTYGAKPEAFCFWLFQVLGLEVGDTLVDLFEGSGAVMRGWERYRQQFALTPTISSQLELEAV